MAKLLHMPNPVSRGGEHAKQIFMVIKSATVAARMDILLLKLAMAHGQYATMLARQMVMHKMHVLLLILLTLLIQIRLIIIVK
jgi:hypothetical protein